MAFRATNALPAVKYDRAKLVAVQMRNHAQSRSAQFSSGANSAEILAMVGSLDSFKVELEAARNIPGMAAYAQDQEDDPTYDLTAEFNAMMAALDAVIAEVVATLPSDGNGWLLINSINPDGTLTPRNFTAGQLNQIRSLLDALAATIS
jgi:hypothetical protein